MKELMVTLLVLSCTGMVLAQQNDNNGFRPPGGTSDENAFGRSSDRESPLVPIVNDESSGARRIQNGQRPDRGDGNPRVRSSFPASRANEGSSASSETSRILDPNRSTLDRFQAGSAGAAQGSNRASGSAPPVLYLGLPPVAMNVLSKNGRVVAKVQNPYVDRIKISDQNTPKAGPSRIMRPQLVGESLVFKFTPDDVDFTHEGSLEFEVPDYMKGKYTSATIELPEVLNRIEQSGPATRTNSGIQSDDSRWRLANDQNVREPIRQEQPWASNQSTQAERDRLARLEYERKYLLEKETREKTALDDQNRQLLDEIARLRFVDQQRQAARIQTQQPTGYPRDPRYAQNTQFDQMQQPIMTRPVVSPVGVDSVSYNMMQKMERMEARIAQLDDQNRRLNSDFQVVKSDRDDLLRGRFDYKNDTRSDLVQDRNRTTGINDRLVGKPPVQNRPAMNLGGFGNSDRKGLESGNNGIVTGQSKTSSNAKRPWDLLLFLMLLGSVALNLYLWALSRGFYMRYQELADELRETFTVSA